MLQSCIYKDFLSLPQSFISQAHISHWSAACPWYPKALVAAGLVNALPPGSLHTFTSPNSYTARLDRVYYAPDSVRAPKCLTLNDPKTQNTSSEVFSPTGVPIMTYTHPGILPKMEYDRSFTIITDSNSTTLRLLETLTKKKTLLASFNPTQGEG